MTTTLTETTPAEVLERIPTEDAVGEMARRMDTAIPGWHERVNPDILNLTSGQYCVLGQACDGNWMDGLMNKLGVHPDRCGREAYFKQAALFLHREHEPRWIEEINRRS